MTIKQMNTYIVRKVRAEAKLAMLDAKSEEWAEITFQAIKQKTNITRIQSNKLQDMANQANKLETDIQFFTEQLLSCDTIANQKFKFN